MYINEQYNGLELLHKEGYRFIGRDGETRDKDEMVLDEHLMDVYINEKLTMKLICIPEFLAELVLGRLFTEGIIESAEDVESIYVCEFGNRAKVTLRDREVAAQMVAGKNAADFVEETPSCCTGNHIMNDYFLNHKEPEAVISIDWKPEWIFDLADRFAEGMPLHEQTWATHSCFLSLHGELLFQCEDIGRHNALDKAIGYALRHGIDLKQCVIYSSGRIPTDMTIKAIRAGIPVLASKASPSHQAIELAKQYNLTLICSARRDRMKVFAD